MTLRILLVLAITACSSEHAAPTAEYDIDTVVQGYPAFGKLAAGDRIIAVDGKPLDRSLSTIVNERNGNPVKLTYVRGGVTLDVTLKPIAHMGNWTLGLQATRVER
jgi:PDZ domain-containing secreted protein